MVVIGTDYKLGYNYTLPKINVAPTLKKVDIKHSLWNTENYWGILGLGVLEPLSFFAWQS